MGDYSYLPQQLEEHFKAHNKNDLDFIELNPLLFCLICFPIEKQSSRQFQDFWNWFLNEHSAKIYTAYIIYYFDQAYFEDDFEKRNNSINQLLYSATFEQQPPDFEYLNYQIHIWITAHQLTETPLETEEESYQTAPVFDLFSSELEHSTQTVTPKPMAQDPLQQNILIALQDIQTALRRRNNTPLPLFRDDFKKAATANQYDNEYKFQIVGGYLQGSSATWFSQETNANAQQRIIRWEATNKTITIESLFIIQRTQPNPLDTDFSDTNLQITIDCIILQRTSTNTNLKVAESENIGANHLKFTKFLFQYYCQHLGLNHNHILAKLAFNFYINKRIAYLLGTPVNIESAREAFYSELIQNTNLPTNHNFQRYSITYVSKGKGKLQTPAVIPKRIQSPTWKKTRVESPTNPSYHYTPESVINITSTGAATLNITSAFEQFLFQSKQRKAELLEPYSMYFKGFNSQSLMPSGLQLPPPPSDFGISDL
ncbi:hypothetical protein G9A89_013928 [Geosiphon pyriformis]|nr:hypothetical protein G9A89_013928 [Geosiphon pyriformis]